MTAVRWSGFGGRAVLTMQVLCATSWAEGAVIHVDDSAVGGANDGTSWPNAYLDLQSALGVAGNADEIRIAQGLYRPGGPGSPRTATFTLPEGVAIQGGYAGAGARSPDRLDPDIHVTTLSGDLNGNDGAYPQNFNENCYNVLTATAATSATSLRGVRITAGYADQMGMCDPAQNFNDRGGGIRLRNAASPVIEECWFITNAAVCEGGGVSFSNGTPTFRNCFFIDNRMTNYAAGYGGGAAAGGRGNPRFEDCEFIDNGPAEVGGAVHVRDGGLFRRCHFQANSANDGGAVHGADFAAVDCVFFDNASGTGGGAFWGRDAKFVNCAFLGNSSGCTAGGGAVIVFGGGGLQLVNCVFSGNSGRSGAVSMGGASAPSEIVNCTFVGNISPGGCGGAGGLTGNASLTRLANSVFWNNSSGMLAGAPGELTVSPATLVDSNIIQDYSGVPGGTNNSNADPLFVDADGPDNIHGTIDDDTRLTALSPARDTGDLASLPADEFDLDADGNVTERTSLDLDQLSRVARGMVDRGAYEFPNACPADIAPTAPPWGDGAVNVDDLLAVINAWGACVDSDNCPADIAPADIGGNDVVNVDDLLAAVNSWGDCR